MCKTRPNVPLAEHLRPIARDSSQFASPKPRNSSYVKRWTRGLRPGTWHRMPAEVRRRRDSQSQHYRPKCSCRNILRDAHGQELNRFHAGMPTDAPRPGSHRWQLFADHRTYVCVSALAKYSRIWLRGHPQGREVKMQECNMFLHGNILRSPTVPEVPVGRSRRLHVRCSPNLRNVPAETLAKLRHCLRQQRAVIFENRCNTPTFTSSLRHYQDSCPIDDIHFFMFHSTYY